MAMKINKYIKTFLLFLVLSLVLFSCKKPEDRVFKKSTILMDTLVTITVTADTDRNAERAIDAAFAEIQHLEKLISFWDTESEISSMNLEAGNEPVKISPQTMELIETADYVSEKTDGAFDATIGPVIRQWDFKKHLKPEPEKLKEALKLVNYKQVDLDRTNSTAFLKDSSMSYDTGGIAKGFAADLAEKVLKANGINAGLVAIAGDIKAFGKKPDGHGWLVSIRNPRETKGNELLASIELIDEGISTSGDYERYFIENGVWYHHILDPKTGMPARGFQSVTVIAPKAVYTDGFSTGIFVMGPEKGIKRLGELGFGGIFVDSSGKLQITENIKRRVKILRRDQ